MPAPPTPTATPLTYAASGLPAGLSIDPATGLISGTIALSAASGSPYAVTVTVTRRRGGRRQRHLQLDGQQHQPESDLRPGLPDQTDAEGDVISLDAGATDPDGDTADLRRQRPAGRPDHRSRHRPDQRHHRLQRRQRQPLRGDRHRHATTLAVDASDTFSWTVSNTNQDPTFDQDLPDQTNAEGDVISLDAGATDPDGDTADLRRQRPAGRPQHRSRHRPDQRHHRLRRRQRQPLRGDRHRPRRRWPSTTATPSAGRSATPTRIRPSTRTARPDRRRG